MKTKVIINGTPRFNESLLKVWINKKYDFQRNSHSITCGIQGDKLFFDGIAGFEMYVMNVVLDKIKVYYLTHDIEIFSVYTDDYVILNVNVKSDY